jgi:hypothetical protein
MHGAVTQWLELTAVIPARDRDEQWTVATAAEESASIHAYTAVQQRDAAVLLDQALTADIQSVTQSVTDAEHGVVRSSPESPKEGVPRGERGSGGRIRTYDQAVDSRRGRELSRARIRLPRRRRSDRLELGESRVTVTTSAEVRCMRRWPAGARTER